MDQKHPTMNREQAYRTQDTFQSYLPQAFAGLLGERLPEARAAFAAGDNEALARIEDAVNALRVPAERVRAAAALVLGKDLADKAAQKTGQAGELLLDGGYVPQMLFSGAATRLGLGAMYFVDVRAAAGDTPKSGQFPLGLGPRQILQYRLALERLAEQSGTDPAQALAKAPLLIHLSESAEAEIMADIRARNFFGFKRANVYFLTQPCGPGFVFQGDDIVPDPESPALPAGHGYPLTQIYQRGEAFLLDENGEKDPLTPCIGAEFRRRGVMVMGSHRVNDLTRLSAEVVDPEKLAMGMALMEDLDDPGEGSNMVVEMVENPENQKGGFWKIDPETGSKALAETLNLKTPDFRAYMQTLASPPYNAFRNLYKLSALEEILPSAGFTPFIRFRNGRMYPETITGECTEHPEMRTEAFKKSGELIHDFKEKRDLPEAVRFVNAQDADPGFAALAAAL